MNPHPSVSATTYPFFSNSTGQTGECNSTLLSPGVVQTDFVSENIIGRTNGDIANAVAVKPLTVSLRTRSQLFMQYSGGIINSTDCGTDYNTFALLVGYGTNTTTNTSYWIV